MAEYILVRSNWTSVNSISLDLICDINIEETDQSTMLDKQEENNDDVHSRLVSYCCNYVKVLFDGKGRTFRNNDVVIGCLLRIEFIYIQIDVDQIMIKRVKGFFHGCFENI